MLKLDLGAGAVSPEGFTPRGNAHGSPIYPLRDIADGSCSVVRASHVLEHFPRAHIADVLREWVRVLAPGGELKIAVPDFAKVAQNYLEGINQPTEGYVMGGQTAPDDFHLSVFDRDSLKTDLAAAGLMLIREWHSELGGDCAALPISLNLSGTKPHMKEIGVSAVMSVPRLCFMDNMWCAHEALAPLKVKLRRQTGAYWGQCIERALEQALAEDKPDAVLTLDYDSVFERRDVALMMQLMCCHPDVDAIAAVQAGRGNIHRLFTIKEANGLNARGVPSSYFRNDIAQVATAHFGLTLIRANRLAALPKPWFHDVPSPAGDWNDGRIDADVAFWRKWEAAGHSLYLANRVSIGHLELQILWAAEPGPELRTITQPISEWRESGKPKGAWR